jgi:hypothetical protein
MKLRINQSTVENPVAIIALVLFSIAVVGSVIAILLFVVLPLIGIVLSGMLAVVIAVLIPIIFWLVIPVVMLSIIGWCFGKSIK